MFSSFTIFERAMTDVIAQRTHVDPKTDLYPSLVTSVATAAFRSSIDVWRSSGEIKELSDLFDHAFTSVSNGLRRSVPTPRGSASATAPVTSAPSRRS
jgi:hypothetical protein